MEKQSTCESRFRESADGDREFTHTEVVMTKSDPNDHRMCAGHVPAADTANSPEDILHISEDVAWKKSTRSFLELCVLGILAGAYIAFGSEFYTIVISDAAQYAGFGISRLLGGLCFGVGLVLVLLCGGALFTGDSLMVAGLWKGRIRFRRIMWNWSVVWIMNFIGALLFVYLVIGSGTWKATDMISAQNAISLGAAKCALPVSEAFLRGIGCNWLVCLAVWISWAAKGVMGKIMGILLPVATFVALGFEHCVANMYFVPKALLLKKTPALGAYVAQIPPEVMTTFTWKGFWGHNLLPVTLGNVVGGVLFVGMAYFLAYRLDWRKGMHG